MSKKAYVSIAKLIAIILMVLVVVMITYNIAEANFDLHEKVSDFFDSAFRFFGLREEPEIPVTKETKSKILGEEREINLDLEEKRCKVILEDRHVLFSLNFKESGRLEWYGQVFQWKEKNSGIMEFIYFRYFEENWQWALDFSEDKIWTDCSENKAGEGVVNKRVLNNAEKEVLSLLDSAGFSEGEEILNNAQKGVLVKDDDGEIPDKWHSIECEINQDEWKKQLKEDLEKACR